MEEVSCVSFSCTQDTNVKRGICMNYLTSDLPVCFLCCKMEKVYMFGSFCHACPWCSLRLSGVSVSWHLSGGCQQCLATQCVQILGSSVHIKLESMSRLLFSSSQLQHRMTSARAEHPGDTHKPWQQSCTCHCHECEGCPDSGVERLRNSIAHHLDDDDDVILIWGFMGRSAAATDASLSLGLSSTLTRRRSPAGGGGQQRGGEKVTWEGGTKSGKEERWWYFIGCLVLSTRCTKWMFCWARWTEWHPSGVGERWCELTL